MRSRVMTTLLSIGLRAMTVSAQVVVVPYGTGNGWTIGAGRK